MQGWPRTCGFVSLGSQVRVRPHHPWLYTIADWHLGGSQGLWPFPWATTWSLRGARTQRGQKRLQGSLGRLARSESKAELDLLGSQVLTFQTTETRCAT